MWILTFLCDHLGASDPQNRRNPPWIQLFEEINCFCIFLSFTKMSSHTENIKNFFFKWAHFLDFVWFLQTIAIKLTFLKKASHSFLEPILDFNLSNGSCDMWSVIYPLHMGSKAACSWSLLQQVIFVMWISGNISPQQNTLGSLNVTCWTSVHVMLLLYWFIITVLMLYAERCMKCSQTTPGNQY